MSKDASNLKPAALEVLEEFIPESVQDEMKNKILLNLGKNLSLEQLENLQDSVKNTHFHNKNYIE